VFCSQRKIQITVLYNLFFKEKTHFSLAISLIRLSRKTKFKEKKTTNVNCESSKITLNQGNVYVVCNGCPENRMDVARAETYMTKNGWTPVKNLSEANLILFNACGRSSKTETNSLAIIKEIENKLRSDQKLIVWGCLPRIDPEKLAQEYRGQISPGSELPDLQQMLAIQEPIDKYFANGLGPVWPMSKSNAPEFLRYQGSKLAQALKKPVLRWDDYINTRFNLVRPKDPSIFYIKISTGCRSNCAYCAVRKSRGLTRSKSIERVADEFQLGLQSGFKKFSLMGTDVGSYGLDHNNNLMDLLEKLTGFDGDYKIYLRNLHPYHMKNNINRFTILLKTGKIKYAEMAAESGSNHVLKLMNRTYTIEEYKGLVRQMREAYPALILRTQLIAGFPAETEADFQESMNLLDDIDFDYVEVYEFSARPGTVAEKIEPKVPDNIKRQRFLRLYRKAVFNHTLRKVKNIVLNRM
jgi:tRNA A37 methylthiotransferase MiaB